MANEAWWRDFFAETWALVQGTGYPEERTRAECDFIESVLRLRPGARILDIPCGTGRHSIELARRGFQMTGADFMPAFLETARTDAGKAAVAPEFVVADMRDFASSEPFDGAFCYFGSFGYFFGDGDFRFLRAVSQALRAGGRFLVETHVMETLLPIHRERDWFWADAPLNSRLVLEERRWNLETGRVESTWTVMDAGRTTAASASIRIYAFHELRSLLESAGFENVEGRDGKTGGPLCVGSPRALIVAQKPSA